MSIEIVDIFLDHPRSTGWQNDGQLDVAPAIRWATSELYERRKWTGSPATEHVAFILDRRINWTLFPKTLEKCFEEFEKAKNIGRNQGSMQWVIISRDYEHDAQHIPRREGQMPPSHACEIVMAAKVKEVGSMIADPSVFFHHRRRAFFRLPSGDMSDFFVRVGNIQKNVTNLARIAYWSLPHLKDVDHVLSESWTISSTVAYMSQLANYYRPDVGCEWSFLEKYLTEGSADVEHIQALALSRNAANKDVLFVVSASASGRLIQLFDDVVNGSPNADRFKKLTLFSLGDEKGSGPVLHSLSGLLKEKDLLGSSSNEDVGDAEIVHIDKSTYIPKYRARRVSEFKVGDDTRATKNFFEKYSGSEIFSLSRRGRTFQDRHHSFHVDILKLLKHKHFALSLKTVLREMNACDAVLYVDSPANREFAQLVQSAHKDVFGVLPVDSFHVEHFENISELEKLANTLQNCNKHVLILEAIFITGRNLGNLSPAIRRMADRGQGTKSKITYLIGLNRPHSPEKKKWSDYFDQASSHADFHGSVKSVETVFLPLLSIRDCPWQRELNAHQIAVHSIDKCDASREIILNRVNVLLEALETGLRGQHVFFKKPGSGEFEFSSGSFFLDTSAIVRKNAEVGVTVEKEDVDIADVVCAVAAAIHVWRCRVLADRVFFDEMPFDNLMNPEIFVDNNSFNDSMLRAAIWRSLLPREVELRRSNSDSESLLFGVLCDGSAPNGDGVLAGEAALAFSWQIRQVIGDEGFEKIEWEYLKEFSKAVGRPFGN